MLPSVQPAEPLRVTLLLDRGLDPLQGRLVVGDTTEPFVGWLGLAVALERAIEAANAPRPRRPDR
jgi:hypothetical protein